jgi:hypothetical protein
MTTALEPLTDRPLTGRPTWNDLKIHCQKIRELHIRQLLAADSASQPGSAGASMWWAKDPVAEIGCGPGIGTLPDTVGGRERSSMAGLPLSGCLDQAA